MILREDVEATDRQLVELAAVARSRNHLIIDSHPVTKERYGFRITPFDRASLTAINPDAIVVLYADPRVIIDRISKNSGGRPSVSEFETLIHETLQQSIAIDYSLMVPAPIYFLDSGRPLDEVVDDFLGLFVF